MVTASTPLKKVLIIDDDPIHNMVSSKIIENAKFANETHKLLSGKKGLEYFQAIKENNFEDMPELLFLDINMPLMNGWEFLSEFEKMLEGSGKKISIYILTSSISHLDIKKAEESEIVKDFITKPLSVEKLNKIKNEVS